MRLPRFHYINTSAAYTSFAVLIFLLKGMILHLLMVFLHFLIKFRINLVKHSEAVFEVRYDFVSDYKFKVNSS